MLYFHLSCLFYIICNGLTMQLIIINLTIIHKYIFIFLQPWYFFILWFIFLYTQIAYYQKNYIYVVYWRIFMGNNTFLFNLYLKKKSEKTLLLRIITAYTVYIFLFYHDWCWVFCSRRLLKYIFYVICSV